MKLLNFQILLIFPGFLFFTACNVLFWKETQHSDGGFWVNSSEFYEVQHIYDKKAEWYPLNQNVKARDYRTEILQCNPVDSADCTVIAEYEGWTLTRSLQGNGSVFFAIRGKSDQFGSGPKDFVFIEPPSIKVLRSAEPEKGTDFLGVTVGPEKTHAVLITSENRRVVFYFYALKNPESNPVSYTISSLVGLPSFRWGARATDRNTLYFQNDSGQVMKVSREQGPSIAGSFPACLNQIETHVSDSGEMFYRDIDGQVVLRKVDGWLSPAKIPYITDPAKLGAGCP